MGKLKTLVFDYNGTVLWDSDVNYRAWSKSVRIWFGRTYTQEEYRKYNGRTCRETIVELFDGKLSDKAVDECVNQQNARYFETLFSGEPKFADGLKELLSFAKEKGLLCIIATSTTDKNMNKYYKAMPMADYFDRNNIVCNNGNFRSKPFPDVYIGALEKFKLNPDECIAFEDTASGLRSAFDAGIKNVVAITGDNTSPLNTDVPYLLKIENFSDPALLALITRLL